MLRRCRRPKLHYFAYLNALISRVNSINGNSFIIMHLLFQYTGQKMCNSPENKFIAVSQRDKKLWIRSRPEISAAGTFRLHVCKGRRPKASRTFLSFTRKCFLLKREHFITTEIFTAATRRCFKEIPLNYWLLQKLRLRDRTIKIVKEEIIYLEGGNFKDLTIIICDLESLFSHWQAVLFTVLSASSKFTYLGKRTFNFYDEKYQWLQNAICYNGFLFIWTIFNLFNIYYLFIIV